MFFLKIAEAILSNHEMTLSDAERQAAIKFLFNCEEGTLNENVLSKSKLLGSNRESTADDEYFTALNRRSPTNSSEADAEHLSVSDSTHSEGDLHLAMESELSKALDDAELSLFDKKENNCPIKQQFSSVKEEAQNKMPKHSGLLYNLLVSSDVESPTDGKTSPVLSNKKYSKLLQESPLYETPKLVVIRDKSTLKSLLRSDLQCNEKPKTKYAKLSTEEKSDKTSIKESKANSAKVLPRDIRPKNPIKTDSGNVKVTRSLLANALKNSSSNKRTSFHRPLLPNVKYTLPNGRETSLKNLINATKAIKNPTSSKTSNDDKWANKTHSILSSLINGNGGGMSTSPPVNESSPVPSSVSTDSGLDEPIDLTGMQQQLLQASMNGSLLSTALLNLGNSLNLMALHSLNNSQRQPGQGTFENTPEADPRCSIKVQLAKKNAQPVQARVSEWIRLSVEFIQQHYKSISIKYEASQDEKSEKWNDWLPLFRLTWHRLLVLSMAEYSLALVIVDHKKQNDTMTNGTPAGSPDATSPDDSNPNIPSESDKTELMKSVLFNGSLKKVTSNMPSRDFADKLLLCLKELGQVNMSAQEYQLLRFAVLLTASEPHHLSDFGVQLLQTATNFKTKKSYHLNSPKAIEQNKYLERGLSGLAELCSSQTAALFCTHFDSDSSLVGTLLEHLKRPVIQSHTIDTGKTTQNITSTKSVAQAMDTFHIENTQQHSASISNDKTLISRPSILSSVLSQNGNSTAVLQTCALQSSKLINCELVPSSVDGGESDHSSSTISSANSTQESQQINGHIQIPKGNGSNGSNSNIKSFAQSISMYNNNKVTHGEITRNILMQTKQQLQAKPFV